MFRADFDLKYGIVSCEQCFLAHVIRRINAQRKRCIWRVCRIKTEQFINRDIQYSTSQIIQCHINSSFSRRVETDKVIEVAHNICNKPRVITKIACKFCHTCQYRLLTLTVILIRGSLTKASIFIISDLHNNILSSMLHTSCNTKRGDEFEIKRLGIDMQHILFPYLLLPCNEVVHGSFPGLMLSPKRTHSKQLGRSG